MYNSRQNKFTDVDHRLTFWARAADQTTWHTVRAVARGVERVPICGAPDFAYTEGESSLPPDTGHTFGPVCDECARLSGIDW